MKPLIPGAGEDSLQGVWQGTLEFKNKQIRLLLRVSESVEGVLAATLESPDAGPQPIETITRTGDIIRFAAKKLHAVYEGTLNKEKSELLGQLKRENESFALPLAFKRLEHEPDWSRPQDPKKPYPYDEEEVVYENEKAGIKLAGTLTLPRSPAPCPAVLLFSGTGAHDRNETLYGHRPFLVLADYLTRQGIAVLRMDDRGVGGSTGNYYRSTDEDFADDALAGIRCLSNRKEINAQQVGLIGHSEGGVVASIAAAKSTDVAFIVLMASPGLSGEQLMLARAQLLSKSKGMTDDQAARHRIMLERMFDVIKREPDNGVAEKLICEILTEDLRQKSGATEARSKEDEVAIQTAAKLYVSASFRYLVTYDARSTLAKVKCPVMALNGEKDVQLTPADNLPAIAAALEAGANSDYAIIKLPNLNHLFQTCQTGASSEYKTIDETIAPVVLSTLAHWILTRTTRRPSGYSATDGAALVNSD